MKSHFLICSVLLLSLAAESPRATPSEDQAHLRHVTPNSALRSHFHRIARDSSDLVREMRRNRAVGESRLLEQQTDLLVEQFVARVNRDMESLGHSARRLRVLETSSPHAGPRRRALIETLANVDHAAEGLSRIITPVVRFLRPSVQRWRQNRGRDEDRDLRFLTDLVVQTRHRIHDAFSRPAPLVSVKELQEDNMLLSLHRVRQISKNLRKSLRKPL